MDRAKVDASFWSVNIGNSDVRARCILGCDAIWRS